MVIMGFIWCFIAMLSLTSAYPTGAPDSVCDSMVPNHPNTTTSGDAPFKIELSATAYKPGSQITGSITSSSQTTFRGFLIQARGKGSAPVGQFINPVSVAQTVCGQDEKQGLTHNNNTDKTSVDFTWQAPASYAGDVVFQLTVVESYDPSRYWLKIMSDQVLDCSLHATSSGCEKLRAKAKTHKKSKKQGKTIRFEKSKKRPNSTF